MGAFAAAATSLSFGWNEDLTGGITRHGEVEDDAAVGKSGHLLQEIVHRQPRQVHELDPAFVRAERPPCHSLPIDIERRAAGKTKTRRGSGLRPRATSSVNSGAGFTG